MKMRVTTSITRILAIVSCVMWMFIISEMYFSKIKSADENRRRKMASIGMVIKIPLIICGRLFFLLVDEENSFDIVCPSGSMNLKGRNIVFT